MRYYKLRRGEKLDERVPDMQEKVEEYFGEVSGKEKKEGVDMWVVEDYAAFKKVFVGKERRKNRKDRVAVHFEEKKPAEIEKGEAKKAIEAKNQFLEDVTGRTAEDRKESMKNQVEGDWKLWTLQIFLMHWEMKIDEEF